MVIVAMQEFKHYCIIYQVYFSVLPYRPTMEHLQDLTLHHTLICGSPIVSRLSYNFLCFILFFICTLNFSLFTVVHLGKPEIQLV